MAGNDDAYGDETMETATAAVWIGLIVLTAVSFWAQAVITEERYVQHNKIQCFDRELLLLFFLSSDYNLHDRTARVLQNLTASNLLIFPTDLFQLSMSLRHT